MDVNLEDLPESFQEIVETFQFAEKNERLELLLEYAKELPPLPPHLDGNRQHAQNAGLPGR